MSSQKQTSCYSGADLRRFLYEQLSESEESEIQSHIDRCGSCQSAMEREAAEQAMWDGLRGLDSPQADPDSSDDRRLSQLQNFLAPTEYPQFLGRLGTYEVCGIIGQGGTGIVVKALDQRLNRYVAIKVLNPAMAGNGPARRRFEREGRAIAAVSHEHVVPIYAVNEYRGLPYIVMQYIPGVSLLHRINKSGSLDTCEVVRIGLQVALGLNAAHSQGIIHRDVKPANVLLEETVERAMVTDFGLARVADEVTMTRSGAISGTPQYMSPEQARGEPVDPRTDLFSLGSLMYAASTARPPFQADTVFGIIHRVCQTEPRAIREINPDIAEWLVFFIDKLMSKQCEARFASAKNVAELLQAELAHLQNPTVEPVPDRTWLPKKAAPARTNRWRSVPNWKRAGVLAAFLAGGIGLSAVAVSGVDKDKLPFASLFAAAPTPNKVDDLGETDRENDPQQVVRRSPETARAVGEERKSKNAKDNGRDRSNLGDPGSDQQFRDGTNEIVDSTIPNAIAFTAITPGSEPVVTWTRDESNNDSVTQIYRQRFEQSLEVTDNAVCSLSVPQGEIQVRQTELDQISLVVLSRIEAGSQAEAQKIADYHQLTTKENGKIELTASLDEGFVARGGDQQFDQLVYGLGIPAGVNVELTTENGTIKVDVISSSVEASATHGDVQFRRINGNVFARSIDGHVRLSEGCTGRVDAMSTHGHIWAANIAGDARLRSSDGHIYVGTNQGKVSAHSTGGDVRINSLACPTAAHVEVGNLVMCLADSPITSAKLSVSNGDLVADMATTVAADVRAWGKVTSVLPFEAEDPNSSSRSAWSTSSLNGGGNTIELIASQGTVFVNAGSASPKGLGGNGEFKGLGGSGNYGERKQASARAISKTSGAPRPGAMVPIEIENGHNIDGYTLYLPVNYGKTDQPYPVLVYLQGGYGVGGEVTQLNDWGLPRLIRDENDLESVRNQLLLDTFIIVSPHIDDGSYDDHPDVMKRILDDVAADYRVDGARVYVTGLSRGGHGSWDFPGKLPGVFAAAAPVGGHPDDEGGVGQFKNIAVWVAHNQGDPTVAWSDSDALVERIESDASVRFKRYDEAVPSGEEFLSERYIFTQPNYDQHDAWTALYSSPKFYQWLLRQSLTKK